MRKVGNRFFRVFFVFSRLAWLGVSWKDGGGHGWTQDDSDGRNNFCATLSTNK